MNGRRKRQASEGRKSGQEVLEKQHKKKGTRPFKEDNPSSLEQEEFHERLQLMIEPLARRSDTPLGLCALRLLSFAVSRIYIADPAMAT